MELIENGANPNAIDEYGKNPLHCAAQNGHTDIVVALTEKRANIYTTDEFGQTPLHYAAKNGHTETVLALIEKDANIYTTTPFGITPLHYAAKNGHTETTLALIEKGPDVNATSHNSKTPLYLAAKKGHTQIVLKLIEKGAKVDATDHNGKTALHHAIAKEKLASALAIIHYGKVPYTEIPVIENNPTSEYIQRQHKLANNFSIPSYARGLFHGMNPSFRETMIAGVKIHFMATGIKDVYLTIMNLLRDKSPSGKPAPSSLPDDLLGIILQYAGLFPSIAIIKPENMMIGYTSAKVLKQPVQREATLTHKDCIFPETAPPNPAAAG